MSTPYNNVHIFPLCYGHTYAKYLAKRVDRILFLLNLLAYSEIVKKQKKTKSIKGFSQPEYICTASQSGEGKDI